MLLKYLVNREKERKDPSAFYQVSMRQTPKSHKQEAQNAKYLSYYENIIVLKIMLVNRIQQIIK